MSSTYPPGQSEIGSDDVLPGAGVSGVPSSADYDDDGLAALGGTGGNLDRGESLRSELRTLKSEVDTLLEHVATLSESELREAYSRIVERFSSARYAAKDMASQAGQQFNRGVDAATEYIGEKPLQAVGIAAGAGLLLGLLLRRR